MLEFGVLIGVPMRPDEIEEIIHTMNQPKVVHTIPDDSDSGNGSAPGVTD
jgi:hypothetical protein